MKIGVTLFAQNYLDWDRYEAIEADPAKEGTAPQVHDAEIYRQQLHLGRLVEPLGFDSLWTVEHHFTPYTMVTSPTQFLAYFAGVTERIGMGTMIVVLPWHDPVQVAENFITLDHMLNGRSLKVGCGRGLGLREYNGMRVPMEESRERFKEALDIVRLALTREWFEYEGTYYQIPRTSIRPQPRPGSTLADNLYIAWGSPQSMPVAAHEGCKPLFIPQRGWPAHREELAGYNEIRTTEHDLAPERPTTVCWVYCADSDAEAHDGAAQYMLEYGDSALRHYQFLGEHLKKTKGYEYYGQLAEQRAKLPADAQPEDIYLSNHVWGSPKTCLEKLRHINDEMGADDFVAVFSYGSMPVEKAEKSMRLFAGDGHAQNRARRLVGHRYDRYRHLSSLWFDTPGHNRRDATAGNAMTKLGEISTCWTLTIQRRTGHPPERLWQAITDPDQVAKWMRLPGARIDLRVGGDYRPDFGPEGGGEVPGVIVRLEPNRLLAWVWNYSVIEWKIERDGDGSRYSFSDHGNPVKGGHGIAAGWHCWFDALGRYLDDVPQPGSEALQASDAAYSAGYKDLMSALGV